MPTKINCPICGKKQRITPNAKYCKECGISLAAFFDDNSQLNSNKTSRIEVDNYNKENSSFGPVSSKKAYNVHLTKVKDKIDLDKMSLDEIKSKYIHPDMFQEKNFKRKKVPKLIVLMAFLWIIGFLICMCGSCYSTSTELFSEIYDFSVNSFNNEEQEEFLFIGDTAFTPPLYLSQLESCGFEVVQQNSSDNYYVSCMVEDEYNNYVFLEGTEEEDGEYLISYIRFDKNYVDDYYFNGWSFDITEDNIIKELGEPSSTSEYSTYRELEFFGEYYTLYFVFNYGELEAIEVIL